MKILVVGGVAGGATAIARLRRLSEEYKLIMVERDEYISYANCGLPYYIGDVIKDKQKLQVQTVNGMKSRFNVDIRTKSEVIAINKEEKSVTIKNLVTGEEYKESYDKLILSCGAKPLKPKIPNIEECDNVFTLRNIPDTYRIKEYVTSKNVKNAVVIGGGFIGVEMAENLRELGVSVTLVEKQRQVMRNFDYEMAQIIHEEINVHGINLILNDGINQFAESGKTVILDSGTKIPTDMTIMALGVVPENTLAKNANLKLGQRGHVVTDNNFNVFDAEDKKEEDIFAIGDMIEVINPLDNSPYAVPLAWGANRQGRLVADYISGIKIKPSKIMGASVIKVFDLTAASTGASEATLIEKKIEYKAIHAHRANHASYYPNSSNIALKLLYGKDGRILGAQAVGREGTEKRIDVISTVMRLNGSVFDLSDLELCYAPPYSSAKDPVNILGYIAENIESGIYSMAYAQDIDKIIESGGLLLDVRTPFEYENGHIEGSLNLELDTLRDNLDKITVSKDTPIYVTCRVGLRAYMAIKILRANGFTKLYNLSGGYSTYLNYKYQTHFTDVKEEKVEKEGNDNESHASEVKEIDVTGIQCPGPLMATFKELSSMKAGEVLKVVASDCGFTADIKNWCKTNGHKLLDLQVGGGKYTAVIEKGDGGKSNMVNISQQNATIVVFSGEIDKVIASMIIAQGAAAQGKDVTMFFTFWGLNALRKDNKVSVKKNLIEKMFGVMMPRGAEKLPLSNMNMGGIGQKMIKSIMKKKNVDNVSLMINKAKEAGVKMIACTMSMDLMGIKAEELIDGIEYAGVATYISKNENVGTTLFI